LYRGESEEQLVLTRNAYVVEQIIKLMLIPIHPPNPYVKVYVFTMELVVIEELVTSPLTQKSGLQAFL
jgi:hypothetical protein